MADSSALPLFLGVIAVCLVAMTAALCVTAWELRTTLRRTNAMLRHAEAAWREARQALRYGRRVLVRVGGVAAYAEAAAARLHDATSGALERMTTFGRHVRTLFGVQVGNGAGADPRRRHRRR